MIENGTDVQKRPCGPGQLASEFGINFGKNRYDFCNQNQNHGDHQKGHDCNVIKTDSFLRGENLIDIGKISACYTGSFGIIIGKMCNDIIIYTADDVQIAGSTVCKFFGLGHREGIGGEVHVLWEHPPVNRQTHSNIIGINLYI